MKALNSFRARVIFLISLIFLLMLAVMLLYFRTEQNMPWVVIGVLVIIGLIIHLFRTIYSVNQQIADFLMSIRYDDFTRTYSQQTQGDPYYKLFAEFNAISDKFRDLRSQNEADRQLMQLVLENVDTGIFCLDKSGKVLLANKALKGLFHKSYFPDLTAFKHIDPALHETLETLPIGERIVQKVVVNDEVVQVAIRHFALKNKEDEISLYTFFNLSGELSSEEIKSYHKLISILSHEIMNSVTPIASLSQSAAGMLKSADPDNMDDIAQAMEVIQKRSTGLLTFTENYRKLTKIPQVQLQHIHLEPFLSQILTLFKHEVPKRVQLDLQFFRPNLQITGDPTLLEQVVINLIKNALEAVQENPDGKVLIVADRDEQQRTLIRISDNGQGIAEENLEQIFVPFFTTKPTGSGIGLSLARQIMRQHQGDIQVVSEVGKGTILTLIFIG